MYGFRQVMISSIIGRFQKSHFLIEGLGVGDTDLGWGWGKIPGFG